MNGIRAALSSGIGFLARQKRSFKVNIPRAAASNFLYKLTQQYQPLYITALGASSIQLGVVSGVGSAAAVGISVPTGYLVDKYGPKRLFTIATLTMTIASIFFITSNNWLMTIPALLLASLALRLNNTACGTVCGSSLKNEDRAVGMQLCDSVTALPSLAGPMIAAFVIGMSGGLNATGIRSIYYLFLAGNCLLLIYIAKVFSDPIGRTADEVIPKFAEGVREVLREGRAVKRWILVSALAEISRMTSLIFWPLYAARIKSVDVLVFGAMGTALTVFPLLLAIPAGRLADKLGRKKLLYIITPCYCLSLILFILARSPIELIVSSALQGTLQLALVTKQAMTMELVPTRLLGRWLGVLGLFIGLVGLFAPIIGGIIWDAASPDLVFLFIIAVELAKLPILVTVPERSS